MEHATSADEEAEAKAEEEVLTMRRSSSWPVDNVRWKKMRSLSGSDVHGHRVRWGPAEPCDVPNLFASPDYGGSSDTSSSDEIECDGYGLKKCLTWRRLHGTLGLIMDSSICPGRLVAISLLVY